MNNASNTLSHNPVGDPEPTDTLAELDNNDNSEMSFAEIRALHREISDSLRLQENMLEMTLSINNYETLP